MTDEQHELIEQLAAAPAVLRALVRDLPEDELRATGTGEEHWSVLEVVCHLRDAEATIVERVRGVRREQRHWAPHWDPDARARDAGYNRSSLAAALDGFEALRAAHITELRALADDEWERVGVHEVGGEYRLSSLVRHMTWHDMIHMAQIARRLG